MKQSLSSFVELKRRVFPILQRFFLRSYADILAQLDYWMERSKKTIDGRLWFYKTYEELARELELSISTVRRAIAFLKSIGVLLVERHSKETWYQANWYSINYEVLFAGIDEFESGIKTIEQIVVFKAIASICSKWSLHSIDSTSTKTPHSLEAESEKKVLDEEVTLQDLGVDDSAKEPQPQALGAEEKPEELRASYKESAVDEIPSTVSRKPNKRINDENREKYVWEIAVGRPYPVFLNWWADTKYKPQGGRWETGAYSCAYSEFYKDCTRTEVAIYPQFLEYLRTVTEICNQHLANDMQPILPSCFIAKPEPSQSNTEALMANVKALIERGASVALPQKVATPSCQQAMRFSEAEKGAVISPLVKFQCIEPRRKKFFTEVKGFEKEIAELNDWLKSDSEILKEQAGRLAIARGYGIERSPKTGEVVKVFQKIESKVLNQEQEPNWEKVSKLIKETEKEYLKE